MGVAVGADSHVLDDDNDNCLFVAAKSVSPEKTCRFLIEELKLDASWRNRKSQLAADVVDSPGCESLKIYLKNAATDCGGAVITSGSELVRARSRSREMRSSRIPFIPQ